MDGQARVGALDRDRMAGVNAHPDSDRRVGRPLVACQRPLYLQRAQDGLLGIRERHEEGVALRVHLVAAMTGDGRPDQAPVLGENLYVTLAQRLHQPGRALDVAEQERDRPTRKAGHALTSGQAMITGTPPT